MSDGTDTYTYSYLGISYMGANDNWLAAGIPQNADAEMIENVIKLFVTENLGAE